MEGSLKMFNDKYDTVPVDCVAIDKHDAALEKVQQVNSLLNSIIELMKKREALISQLEEVGNSITKFKSQVHEVNSYLADMGVYS